MPAHEFLNSKACLSFPLMMYCICRGSLNFSLFVFQDLEQRHNTILQMYGEKAEEAEELRLDLEDVKNMYKTQIDELLRNQK